MASAGAVPEIVRLAGVLLAQRRERDGVECRQRQRVRTTGERAAARLRQDAAEDVAEIDRLNVVRGEKEIEIERRDPPVRPDDDVRQSRLRADVGDRDAGS